MRQLVPFMLVLLLLLAGCAGTPAQIMDDDGMVNSYSQISQEEAKQMMARDDGHVIVDVRRKDEYEAGHIPGAICIPNESIGTVMPELLPDLNQIILIYCRSGNRSKQAAQKLFDLGYLNIYELGGILDWTGEIVKEDGGEKDLEATLSFDSFDGGGPEFRVSISDPDIVSYTRSVQYGKPDHDELTGSGYTVTYTFAGLKPGETAVTVSARSPIADNYDAHYLLTVDETLRVSVAEQSIDMIGEGTDVQPVPILAIAAGNRVYYAALEENSSAEALVDQLGSGKIEIEMHDYGGFEKVGPLPWELPANDERITTQPGDVILYQGNQITIYYDENTWIFTRLARIDGVTKAELLDALGDRDVTVSLWIEWDV